MPAVQNTPFDGAAAPFPISGVGGIFPPHWAALLTISTGLSTTATRLYFIPYYFPAIVQYTGLKTRNLGTGDNAKVFRMGVYQASPTTGLPSTLIVDAGEVTLSGAAADRTLATAWTPPYIGWGYLAHHANAIVDIANICDQTTGSNVYNNQPNRLFGIGSTQPSLSAANFGSYYVDTTYGPLAANAVAPTAITNIAPAVLPYRT